MALTLLFSQPIPGEIDARAHGVRADNATDNLGPLGDAIDAATVGVSGGEGNAIFCDPGVMLTSNQIKLKNKVRLAGANKRSTQLVAGAGFPPITPVLRLGSGAGFVFDCRVENMLIHARDIPGSQCVYSQEAQEGCGVFDCLLAGYRDFGIYFDGQGSGGVADLSCAGLEVYASSLGSNGGILFYRVPGSNSIKQVTVVGGGPVTTRGVQIHTSSVSLYDVHVEGYVDGIECGTLSSGMIVGPSGHQTVTNVVHFDSGTNGWTTVGTQRNGSLNSVRDDFNGKTIAADMPGIYNQSSAYLGFPSVFASTTAGRSGASSFIAGTQAYDTTLRKPIWSDGTNWRDASGQIV